VRTLVSTIFVGVGLLASPALVHQHPWISSGVSEPIGKLPNGELPVPQHPWVSGASTLASCLMATTPMPPAARGGGPL
jgi:hypothetical protein